VGPGPEERSRVGAGPSLAASVPAPRAGESALRDGAEVPRRPLLAWGCPAGAPSRDRGVGFVNKG